MNCDDKTPEGILVKVTDTGREGNLAKGPADVVWVRTTNSCWVLFDGESEPKLVPCAALVLSK